MKAKKTGSKNLPILPRQSKHPFTKINTEKAIELRLKGLSYQDIANHFGCSKAAVIQHLSPYVADADEVNVEAYKKNRADIFAGKQLTVLKELTGENLKKIIEKSPMAGVTLFNSLFNNERLERGQSTQNIAAFCAAAVIRAHTSDDEAEGVPLPEPSPVSGSSEGIIDISGASDQ